MIRLVLFDIDGTLINTGGAGEKAFARVCEFEFKVADGSRNLSFAGRTDPAITREFFTKHAIQPTEQNLRRFFDAYVFMLEYMLKECEGRVLPGVHDLIANFRRMPEPPLLGLLTGNVRLGAQIKLRHYGLWGQFVTGAFGDDNECRDQLAGIARERGGRALGRDLRGDEVLVIGDTPLDVRCANAIGAKVIAVATGRYTLSELGACKPGWTVATLDECCLDEICA
jgi:phosphoglycolate phosphatase